MTRKKISKQLTIGLFIGIFLVVSLAILINANQFKKSTSSNNKDLDPLKVQSFTKVHIHGAIRVNFVNSDETILKVNDHLINNGSVSVTHEGSTLKIKSSMDEGKNLNAPSVIVYTNHLTELILTDNAKVNFKDYTGDSLNIAANHSEVKIHNFTLNYCLLKLNNDAHFSGESFSAKAFEIDIENKSSIWSNDFNAEQMNGKINNGSWISYQGTSPSMNLQVDDKSKVNKY